jgi:hypothetical protein
MLTFEDLLQEGRRDPRILGVILSGSRGRAAGRADSDWDAYLIVADDAAGALNRELGGPIDALLDLSILTLSEFESYAAPGSEHAWEAYAFVHAAIAYDRLGGRIGEIAARSWPIGWPAKHSTRLSTRRFAPPRIGEMVRMSRRASTKRNPSVPRSKPCSPWSAGSARTTAT